MTAGATNPAIGEMVSACRDLVAERDSTLPIPLKPLLSEFNARWQEKEMTADGLLRRDGDGYLIHFSEKQGGWRRRRFTIAHELAHLILLERLGERGREIAADLEWNEVERLCNIGAAEILLPRDKFAKALRECGFSRRGLAELYERFGVSWSVLFIRIAEVIGEAGVSLWASTRNETEGRSLRLAKVHFGQRRFWLPTGLSPRYLEPKLVEEAAQKDIAASHDFTVRFGGSEVAGRGLAISLKRLRKPSDCLFPEMDEPELDASPAADVALLMLPPLDRGSELIEALWQRSLPAGVADAPDATVDAIQLELSVP